MDYWVFDLSSLRYRVEPTNGHISVLSDAGELLASVAVPAETSERESVFLALDDALANCKLVRPEGTARLALLNPYSNQVAIDPVPETVSYQASEPLQLPRGGTGARLRDGLLQIEGQVLVPVEAALSSVTEAITAHRR